ncbi:unnamed protein product [Auanema sp. JU1783]|nr:unnamed protein product [Auanema sp. JU1783]
MIKLIFCILCISLTTTYAAVHKVEISSTGSTLAKLVRKGLLQEYLAERNLARTQVLATGSEPFLDYYDEFYLGKVLIGTPAQTLQLGLDTASSNLWVIDSNCTTQACNGVPASGYTKTKFDSTRSSTFTSEKRTFTIRYGLGSCKGYLSKDKVSFGGLTIDVQEFGVSTHLAKVFGSQPLDGMMGLAWPALAVDNVVPPMQNVLPQLDQPIFTVFLRRRIDDPVGANGGLITYGGLDTVNCDSKINYVELTSETYWQFQIHGFSIGDYTTNRKAKAISDTGTSWIGCPEIAFNGILQQTKAQYSSKDELYLVPCDAEPTLPDLIFTINDIKYNIPAIEYVLDIGLGNGKCAITFFSQSSGGFTPSWNFGDTFIRTYCNIYDIGQKRIGFALAKQRL